MRFDELWTGDGFRSGDRLWTKVGSDVARLHSKESLALGERGYGYRGDALCSFDPDDEVEFAPPIEVADDVAGLKRQLAQACDENNALRAMLHVPKQDCESTAEPWWVIISPRQIMRPRVHGIASCIEGPYFSREAAQGHLDGRRYAYGDNARVYCLSGCYSHEYKEFIKAAKSRDLDNLTFTPGLMAAACKAKYLTGGSVECRMYPMQAWWDKVNADGIPEGYWEWLATQITEHFDQGVAPDLNEEALNLARLDPFLMIDQVEQHFTDWQPEQPSH